LITSADVELGLNKEYLGTEFAHDSLPVLSLGREAVPARCRDGGESPMRRKMDKATAQKPEKFTHFVEMVDTGDILGMVYLDQMVGQEWTGRVRLVPDPAHREDARKKPPSA
jgi:hypothetical protein